VQQQIRMSTDQERHAYAEVSAAGNVNDVMAAILKVWRHIKNPTLSIDAYSFEEN